MIGYRKDGVILSVATIYRDVESLRAEQALFNRDPAALEELFASG
jgi:hypothetical protein